jgi:type II secretory pathway component PulF
VDAGVPLSQALTILKGEVQNKALAELIQILHQEVMGGEAFSEALAKHPRVFSSLYIHFIYAGEISGTLPNVLTELDEFFEQEEELRGKIQAALAYPLAILGFGILTIWFLLVFITPKIVSVFVAMGQALPIPTQILLIISRAIQEKWWVFLLVVVVGSFFLKGFYQSRKGRLWIDNMKLSIPFSRELELKLEISRFCRTLALLLHHGIPIMTAIRAANDILNNRVISEEITALQGRVKEGESLSGAMARCKTIPKDVKSVIAVGEESGRLEQALGKLGDYYFREVNQKLKIVMSLIEPLMILLLGGMVGFMVIAMLLPIFEINLGVAR